MDCGCVPSTFAHVLCDDVNGLLRHNSVKLHQLIMTEFLHDLSLLQEGLWGHRARLQSLHCHLSGAIPRSWYTEAGISTVGKRIRVISKSSLTTLCSNPKT